MVRTIKSLETARKLAKKPRGKGVDLGKLPDKLHFKTKARAKSVIEEAMGVKSSKAKN